ncbi:RDD family protein [Streptomyces albidus (ex Kaewkla and Franco 2022)]|uniref:RDD family protein n=1 Tax=Streptomyces albidus (ex Kaewkla and Franco 2022) TaxID=722709 RepID=UPI0015EF1C3D|nr:RDD family protein [Streptomyces albidus (ex Kaewkla and Franco 2022)]
MSTDEPDQDPFRKREQPKDQQGHRGEPGEPGGSGEPPPSYGGGPYGSPPPGPGGADPYGSGAQGPYAGGPYASNPYGGVAGAADPLAGMPPLASRGKRLLARIIDALLIAIPVGLIMGLAQGGWGTGDDGRIYGQQGVYTLVYVLYEGLMLTKSGQTVGKRLMRIRVALLSDGAVPRGAPGWIRTLVYHVPPLVPCVGFLFWLVNVLFCTWDKPYQQCLHDKTAKTVVVAAD